jgi:hypothetical protein
MRFVAFRARVHVSVSHRCLCATYDRGPCLEERMAELRARFDRIQDVHVLPEVTRLDATETCATEDVLAAIAGGGELPVERASGRELDRLAGALAALRDEEELVPGSPIARLLGRTAARPSRSTPAQAQAQASVTAADTAAADTAAAAAADRFARDFIFGLQLYRFPTLADGLLALDLARSQIETTEDIMLWESALASNAFPAWFAGAQRGL